MIKKLSRILAVLVLAASTLAVIPPSKAHAIQQERIVYSGGTWGGIVSINPDGSDAQEFSTNTATPAVSPNGSKIAYVKTDSGIKNIYMMDANGSNEVKLTNLTAYRPINVFLSWSPDGSKLVYSRSANSPRDSAKQDIFVLDIASGEEVNITNSLGIVGNSFPSWSPDGSKILFGRNNSDHNNSDIYTMDPDGSNIQQLTSAPDDTGYARPKWSPDGSKISFEIGLDVAVMNADGSNQASIITGNNTQADGQEAWSPDGTKLVTVSGSSPTLIRTFAVDGSGSNTVTSVDYAMWPNWSPDGSQIAFSGTVGTESGLFKVSADGSGSPNHLYDYGGGPLSWRVLNVTPPDTTAPTVSSFTLARKTSTQTENFAVTATDSESGVASGEFYYGNDPGQGNGTAMTYDGTQLHGTLGTNMPVGTYQVYVRAVDNASNWSDPVSAKLVVTQPGTTRVTASGSFTPSTANGDQLPSLDTASFKLAQYNQNVSFGNNGIVNSSSASFTYTYGSSVLCGLFPTLPQCHRLTFTASGNTAITSLVFSGTNNSQATVTGTAQVTVDGTTTTNPFEITAVSSARAGSGSNSYRINIYNPGSNIAPANLLYTASNTGTVNIN